MPASLVPPGKQTFADINGAPLVGGFVYMYLPLTLTPKNTWENAEQTVLNTNPVVLDSRGQAVIYGTGSYRQILTDSLSNQIWDTEIEDFQQSVFGPQDSINAATDTDLGTVSSNNVLVNGTGVTINSFGTAASLANPVYLLSFNGINTITYNATSLILPGAADITTAAGDTAMAEFINAAGYWKIFAYFNGASGGTLGTAASKNIGTAGGDVPLLNGNNDWSGVNFFENQTYGTQEPMFISGGGTTPDFSQGNNFFVSISTNLGINNPINAQQGQSGVLIVNQTNSGLSVTFGTAFKAPGGIGSLNISGINGATDFFAFYVQSTSFIVLTPILNPT